MQIEKVVLVDDDPSIRRIAQICLTKLGPWQVDLAGSGAEALTVLSTSLPDVLILDVMMPEMNGFEFAEAIFRAGCEVHTR